MRARLRRWRRDVRLQAERLMALRDLERRAPGMPPEAVLDELAALEPRGEGRRGHGTGTV